MATNLEITKRVENSAWVVSAHVMAGSDIPASVFVYNNTGESTLGDYFGVVSLAEFRRLREWQGEAIPVFGNKYVRSDSLLATLPITSNPDTFIANVTSTLKSFRIEFLAGYTSTEIVSI